MIQASKHLLTLTSIHKGGLNNKIWLPYQQN